MRETPWGPLFEHADEERRVLRELAARYPGRPSPMAYERQGLIDRAQRDLAEFADGFDVKGAHCLDLACGSGAMAYVLYLSGAERAVGIDLDGRLFEPSFLQVCNTALSFQRGDAVRLAVADESIDRITLINALQLISPLTRLFAEISRVLRPGGRVLIRCGPLYYSPDGGHMYNRVDVPYVHLLFSSGALRELLGEPPPHVWRLNRMTRRDLFELIRLHGLRVVALRESTCDRGAEILERFPALADRYPREDLLVCNVDCVLEVPEDRC